MKKAIERRTAVLIIWPPKIVSCLKARSALIGCSLIKFVKWPVSLLDNTALTFDYTF